MTILQISLCPHLVAQDPQALVELGEDLLYLDVESGSVEEYLALSEGQGTTRVDLNLSSREELAGSGLFTAFQIHQLIRYREKYGLLFSIYELAGITGFTENRVKAIAKRLTVGPSSAPPVPAPEPVRVILKGESIFPVQTGYGYRKPGISEKVYEGSPVKTSLKARASPLPRLLLGFAYEKDPGEPFLIGYRPQFFSGYVRFRGGRYIREWVGGTFRLQQGMGLVHGNRGMWGGEGIGMHRYSMARIRPYASCGETGYEKGMACSLSLPNGAILFWGSLGTMDFSPSRLDKAADSTPLVRLMREDGLHRTLSERAGRSTGFRGSSGIQLYTRHRTLALGMLLCSEYAGLTSKGKAIASGDFGVQWNAFASVHWQWVTGKLEGYGEAAMDLQPAAAIILGLTYNLSDFLKCNAEYHRSAKEYRGIQPAITGWGSQPGNENGMEFRLQLETAAGHQTELSADVYRFPFPRYQVNIPSRGFRWKWILSHPGSGRMAWKVRIRQKGWQKTTDRKLVLPVVTYLDGTIGPEFDSIFSWISRMVISLFREGTVLEKGMAISHQFSFVPVRNLKITGQFVLFHVPFWDQRIYLYEPGFYLSYSFPVYYGKGQKTSLVIKWDPGGPIVLSGRFSETNYQDRKEIGSGNDRIPGNRKWEAGMQLMLRF